MGIEPKPVSSPATALTYERYVNLLTGLGVKSLTYTSRQYWRKQMELNKYVLPIERLVLAFIAGMFFVIICIKVAPSTICVEAKAKNYVLETCKKLEK